MLFRTVPRHSFTTTAIRSLNLSTSASRTPFLLRPRPLFVASALGLSIPFIKPRPVTHFDVSPSSDFSTTPYTHSRDAKTPLTRDGKTLNPAAVKQISLGGICGLGAGILLSAFSRSLTLFLGIGIVVWQYAARRGYNIIPVDKVQRYVKGVNLRSAINDNVAFKISFGLMFALTSFGELMLEVTKDVVKMVKQRTKGFLTDLFEYRTDP